MLHTLQLFIVASHPLFLALTTSQFFWTANIHLPSVQHCRFDNFGSFAPSGPHATTFSSSSVASPHRCLR
ncbi:hypothetical protein OUZ56_015995 [Daphnia magna]|uniref:Secreted protein n=1 Tax=Daphnia magna TaxID=35525 RepID=A0ABR0APC2_9CRUS|nr:hypothetical protein OUZ56_015995 [Daphnia magna]